MDEAFYELDAPVGRVCSAEVPVPYAKHLEEAALPQIGHDRRRGPACADRRWVSSACRPSGPTWTPAPSPSGWSTRVTVSLGATSSPSSRRTRPTSTSRCSREASWTSSSCRWGNGCPSVPRLPASPNGDGATCAGQRTDGPAGQPQPSCPPARAGRPAIPLATGSRPRGGDAGRCRSSGRLIRHLAEQRERRPPDPARLRDRRADHARRRAVRPRASGSAPQDHALALEGWRAPSTSTSSRSTRALGRRDGSDVERPPPRANAPTAAHEIDGDAHAQGALRPAVAAAGHRSADEPVRSGDPPLLRGDSDPARTAAMAWLGEHNASRRSTIACSRRRCCSRRWPWPRSGCPTSTASGTTTPSTPPRASTSASPSPCVTVGSSPRRSTTPTRRTSPPSCESSGTWSARRAARPAPSQRAGRRLDHGHEPGRPGSRVGLRRHRPSAGGARRLRLDPRRAVGGGRPPRRASGRPREPRRRPPRHRRPRRSPLPGPRQRHACNTQRISA